MADVEGTWDRKRGFVRSVGKRGSSLVAPNFVPKYKLLGDRARVFTLISYTDFSFSIKIVLPFFSIINVQLQFLKIVATKVYQFNIVADRWNCSFCWVVNAGHYCLITSVINENTKIHIYTSIF